MERCNDGDDPVNSDDSTGLAGMAGSATGKPFHDAVPFATKLVDAIPDRVLWGTDWPHPNVSIMPNDGELVDLIPLFAHDPVAQHKILVDNPARLYKF